VRDSNNAFWQVFDLIHWNDHFIRSSSVTEARSQVYGGTDVVVAFEEQCKARCDTNTDREWGTGRRRAFLQFQTKAHSITLVDGYEHAAIAEPFSDTHSGLRCHITSHGAPRRQKATGRIVAVLIREVRKP
jgi:hypothetical protein